MEPRPRTDDPLAELELFLRESDREDPILPAPRPPDPEAADSIDEQILAGLVNP